MKYEVSDKIKDYYDKASIDKIRDFIYGNARVEKAWATIQNHVVNPENILEIGCGIGAMCHRCNLKWPDAQIAGIDISGKSIEIAKKLFETKNCKFYKELTQEDDNKKKYDLIILIDVIEHVEKKQRPQLISFIENNISENGILLLAFPTPYMLSINRKLFPEKLQPVEENVYMLDLLEISKVIKKPLVLYMELFVWEKRDYAHAIFADRLSDPVKKIIPLRDQIAKKIKTFYQKTNLGDTVEMRKKNVFEKLNIEI